MTDKEDAFDREVEALEKYDGRRWMRPANYRELAAYFQEIARRAMTCAFRAEEAQESVEEAAREERTASPDWELE